MSTDPEARFRAELATEDAALRGLVETVYEQSGLDFRHYARASLRRRVLQRMRDEGLDSVARLQQLLATDEDARERLVQALALNPGPLFHDADFYRTLRVNVVPALRSWPFPQVWVAGCGAGADAWSLAILLHEEDLGDRCRIYATDLSETVIERARRGELALADLRASADNYMEAGGQRDLSQYYEVHDGVARLRPDLREAMVFGVHSLASDDSPNEFHLVLCRNVLISFDVPLHERALRVITASLCRLGYLGLGVRETLAGTGVDAHYLASTSPGLYRKVRT